MTAQAPMLEEVIEKVARTPIEDLWHWTREREATRLRKDSGAPAPWTNDPIIAKYRFCNVRREDDRVTVWMRQNIREAYEGHPYLWLMLCIARQINWPETLFELMESCDGWPLESFDPSFMEHVMNDRAARGCKVYTGAYTINAPPVKGTPKTKHTAHTVIGELWKAREKFAAYFASPVRTLRGTHAMLSRFIGWGPFMAYQAVVDMRFTELLQDAPDVLTWAAAGPGTLRGLNRVHGRPVTAAITQDRALSEIRRIYAIAEVATGVAIDFSDVPNMLCETDKYLRVKNGEGAPRANYLAATQERLTPTAEGIER